MNFRRQTIIMKKAGNGLGEIIRRGTASF